MRAIEVGAVVYVFGGGICSGQATVEHVDRSLCWGNPTTFIQVKEIPGRVFNWELLSRYQHNLNNNWAYPEKFPSIYQEV